MPASCIDIETATDTSVFRADGTDGLFGDLIETDAVVLFVDTATSTVTTGSFEQLAAGQVVELFGETVTLEDLSTRFEANEILVDGPLPASE